MAYLALFLTVSLLASALAGSSRVALIVLLGFWILNAMVAPRLVAAREARRILEGLR